ncbi:MAG TPA: hypothetical protein VFW75_16920 [Acetobacteraceae bacterium]|nr:hypothetical protein [Acetobacteraceae bacterium]
MLVQGHCDLQPDSGCPVISATARAVDKTGASLTAPDGSPIAAAFQHTSNQDEITAAGGIGPVMKCCLLALLGEPTTPLWTDPIHATMLTNVSIRTAIASAAHAGPIDAGSLL